MLLWPPAKQFAMAFHEGVTLELREGLTSLVGAAPPHMDYGGRASVPEMVDEPSVVSEVILERSPHASRRLRTIVHCYASITPTVPRARRERLSRDADDNLTLACYSTAALHRPQYGAGTAIRAAWPGSCAAV